MSPHAITRRSRPIAMRSRDSTTRSPASSCDRGRGRGDHARERAVCDRVAPDRSLRLALLLLPRWKCLERRRRRAFRPRNLARWRPRRRHSSADHGSYSRGRHVHALPSQGPHWPAYTPQSVVPTDGSLQEAVSTKSGFPSPVMSTSLDAYVVGALLLAAAWAAARSASGRALLAAAWGFACGIMYARHSSSSPTRAVTQARKGWSSEPRRCSSRRPWRDSSAQCRARGRYLTQPEAGPTAGRSSNSPDVLHADAAEGITHPCIRPPSNPRGSSAPSRSWPRAEASQRGRVRAVGELQRVSRAQATLHVPAFPATLTIAAASGTIASAVPVPAGFANP